MILKTVINPDQERKLISLKGYKIERHDFGAYRNEYHNKAEWISNWQDGVLIGQYWYRVEDAIRYLYPDGIVLDNLIAIKADEIKTLVDEILDAVDDGVSEDWNKTMVARLVIQLLEDHCHEPYSVEPLENNVV